VVAPGSSVAWLGDIAVDWQNGIFAEWRTFGPSCVGGVPAAYRFRFHQDP
jgi:hypothetical protein